MAPPIKLSLPEIKALIQAKKTKPLPDDMAQLELERQYKQDKKNDEINIYHREYHPSGRLLSYTAEYLEYTITKSVDKKRKSIIEDVELTLDAIKKQLEGETDEKFIKGVYDEYEQDLKRRLERSQF